MSTFWVSFATAAVAFAVYANTAARTITWWDGSSYPLAACTLGITAPPGSLLLTLLGWAATRLPIAQPVSFQLNLLAALLAACVVGIVTRLAIELSTPDDWIPAPYGLLGGAVAGLTLAFSPSLWTHAIQFTPYVLTALFTALIFFVALAWWNRAGEVNATGWLFLLFLLFGLDVSAHRTNLLLLPAALLWITLRRPSVWRRPGPWLVVTTGLIIGLSLQLVLILLARRDPLLNIDDPSDLARLWSYIRLERFGGGFLVHVWPRAADFVRVQLGDFLRVFRQDVWPPLPWHTGILPLGLGLVGWLALVRVAPRCGLGILAFFLSASLGAVLYFNLPEHYFRPMGRHYLPAVVLFVPLIGPGVATVLGLLGGESHQVRGRVVFGLGALLLLVPAGAWEAHRRQCDLSRVRFTETYSRDVLETLPARAILITNGDNDTFPLWYLQQVEGVRRDVTVVNLPSTNLYSYLAQLRRHDPTLAHLLEHERGTGILAPVTAGDTLAKIPVAAGAPLGVSDSIPPLQAMELKLSGTRYGEDRVVLDLIRLNGWQRPILLACTVSRGNLGWLWPYAHLDGLSFRVLPSTDPASADLEHVRRVLLEQVRYAGVADSTIRLDSDSRMICRNYASALIQLAQRELAQGDPQRCLDTLDFLVQRVPLQRLGGGDELIAPLRREAQERIRADAGG